MAITIMMEIFKAKLVKKADPYRYKLKSTLLKVSFQPTENHRLTLAADLYDNTSKVTIFLII